jgi:hypothetical protein
VDFFKRLCGCYDFQELVPLKRLQHDLFKKRMLLFYNVDFGVSMSSAKSFYKILKKRRLGIFQTIFLIDSRQGLIPRRLTEVNTTASFDTTNTNISLSLSQRLLHKESSQKVGSVKDQDILQHLQALSNIIQQEMVLPSSLILAPSSFMATEAEVPTVAVTEAVSIESGDMDLENFDNYLVTEALLIEFCLVLLPSHQDGTFKKKPSETVGASSWRNALEFLQNPLKWGESLIQIQLFNLTFNAKETLLAYEQHSKWPHEPNQVRSPFRCLYHFANHVIQILTKIDSRGGWLISQDLVAAVRNGKHFTVLTI